jgi:hypothetical protein
MLSPTDSSNQWLESFLPMVFQVTLAHIPEILRGETKQARELQLQIGGQVLHDGLAPFLLDLSFHSEPTDVPIESHELSVDGAKRLILGGVDAVFDFHQQAPVLRATDWRNQWLHSCHVRLFA